MIWLVMAERFEANSVTVMLKALIVGLRFDLVIAGMITLPFWLVFALIPGTILSRVWFRQTITVCSAFSASFVLLVCIVDFFFFKEFGEHLNHKAVHYIKYDYVHRIIVEQFPVFSAMTITVIAFWLFRKCFLRGGFSDLDSHSKAWQVGLYVFISGILMGVAIRGSLGPKAINTGPAYFSNSAPVAQLALNGIFTLRETLISLTDKSIDLERYYPIMPIPEAIRLTRELFSYLPDQFLEDPENPLRRISDSGQTEKRFNIVLVVLESLSWPYIGAMGGKPDLTPNLSAIAKEGWLFDRCFAVGKRTTHAFAGIVSGFPDLPGDSVTTRSQAENGFLTIATILKKRGFETMFIYGGQPHYDHRQAFLGSNGYSRFVFEDQFVSHNFRTHLGWSDEDLFNTAHHVFSSAEKDRPFFATLLTLSFHRPYTIPKGRITLTEIESIDYNARQINAVRYADWAIGQFMDKARQSNYFDNTIFVFTADHMGGFKEHPTTVASFRIPFIIFAPSILSDHGTRISKICSQTDIPPTILSLLGGKYEHSFFGSNILERNGGDGVALIQSSTLQLHLIDSNQNVVTVPPFGGSVGVDLSRFEAPDQIVKRDLSKFENARLAKRMSRQAIAILQTANLLFQQRSYRLRKTTDQ